MIPTFGPAFDPQKDGERLGHQHEIIRDWMLRSFPEWKSLQEIARALHFPESSISAQLRHLRKPDFGAYLVEKRRRTDDGGTWEYRVVPPGTLPLELGRVA